MELVARASITFWFLFLLTRGMRKRTLGDLAPFELLFLMVVGDIVQQGVTQEDMSLTGGILGVSTFAFWAGCLAWLSWKSDVARKAIEGVPLVLYRDGALVTEALAAERMPVADLLEAARQEGIGHLDEVDLAILEPSGRISFIRRR